MYAPARGDALPPSAPCRHRRPSSSGFAEVGALAVVIDDDQHLGGGGAVADHAVRRHGVEAGCLPGFHEDLAITEPEADGAVQDGEPVAAGMDPRFGKFVT